MTLDEYQKQAVFTAIYPGRGTALGLAYVCLGLAGESGEVAENTKKMLRDDDGRVSEERQDKVRKELGDVLWYVANVAAEYGLTLGEIAEANGEKLRDRKERGVLKGSGDER